MPTRVNEAIEVMQGRGPSDVREITLALAGELFRLEGRAPSREAGELAAAEHLSSGATYEKFCEMVHRQGGDAEAARPLASTSEVAASRDGFVGRIDTEKLGMTVIELGGGRKVQGDKIDHSVGLETLVKIGDRVEAGQSLVRMFAHGAQRGLASQMVLDAIEIEESPVQAPELIVGTVE